MSRRPGGLGWAAAAAVLVRGGAALAASPVDRLKGVSEHARTQAASGPRHLWVGIGIGLVFVAVVAVAAWWTLRKGRR